MALIILILVTLFITLFLFFLDSIIFKPGNKNLPPGSMGWPIIGETFSFLTNPEKFITERKRKYSSDIFKTSLIGQKIAILCGPSANKFIFSNESRLFTFWLPPSVAATLGVTNIDMTTSSMKLVTEELHKFLKLDSLKLAIPLMDAKARDHLKNPWSEQSELKIHPLARDFTFSLSCHLFINCSDEQVKKLLKYFNGMNDGGISFKINFPGTDYYKSLKREKGLRKEMVEIVKERRKLIAKDGFDVDGCPDLLSRVLVISNANGVRVDDEAMAARFISMLFASFFTTSNTICFSLGFLAQFPLVYDTVLQEQLEIAKSKEEGEGLNWNDIQKMKYTWNVVCESMRLQPPAFGSFREVIADFTYAGYTVPKGWKIHWDVHTTNKDPQQFPDPETFDPSRFEENKVPPFAFIPFGGGPKMCTGKEYTRVELLVFLHNIVTKFKLERVNVNEKVLYTPNPVPAEGLRLRLEPHQKF